MSDKIIDVPAESEPSQALTVREAVQALDKPTAPDKPPITAAQAKVDAIATLTQSAYARASELRLTAEESDALQADFPDEAFKPGAAGKSDLLYVEHAFLRDRLNKVFGIGQWAIIPRSRWAEDFRTSNGKEASRVYTESMLLVRGCFVSESIGEMVYWKNNEAQNYADAVEGAKTASLRRCCKEIGVGLQAWKKDWCAGWWERHNASREGATRQQPTTRIEHPRNQTSAAPQQSPAGEQTFPVCEILMVAEKPGSRQRKDKQGKDMVDDKGQPIMRHWITRFIKVSDGIGEFEVITFDDKLGDLAKELEKERAKCRLVTKLGSRAGSLEIVLLERAGAAQAKAPIEDDVPFNFDEHGQPIQETIP